MLSVILACDDPYRAATFFVERLGWELVFATPADSDDRLACVELGGAQVMLGVASEEFLAPAAREYRGAGVEVYVRLPGSVRIGDVYDRHAESGAVTGPLEKRPWGETAFQFEAEGYRFMVAQE